MNVSVKHHDCGDVHIVFENRHGIEIEAFEAAWLRRQLRAWERGEEYVPAEEEYAFVFVDLPRDENDTKQVSISLGRVWYEIPRVTAMGLMKELEQGTGA
jgi:hypothetical protein